MKNKGLFPDLPEDITGLTPEELQVALDAHREVARKIHTRDAEFYAENEIEPEDGAILVEQFESGVVSIKAMEARQAEIAEEIEETTARMAELAAEAGLIEPEVVAEADDDKSDDDDEDESGDSEDDKPAETTTETTTTTEVKSVADEAEQITAEAAAEPEPVVAAAPPKRRYRAALPAASPERSPQANADGDGQPVASLVAAAGLADVSPGHRFEDRSELAEALATAFDNAQVAPGFRQDVRVASAKIPYPAERRLGDGSGSMSDQEKIDAVVSPMAMGTDPVSGLTAMLADGGICAARTPLYDLPIISVADRPVKSGLPGFEATRGGISVPGALSLGSVSTAVGTVTAAEDEQGGTFAQKSCQRLECDPYTDYDIVAQYACVEWGNFGARTWPERVANFADLVAAAHARMAESYLLTGIDAASTAVTAANAVYGYGVASNLLSQILAAGAAMKSRHRASPNMRLRAIFPFWVREHLVSDLRNSQFNRFDQTVAGVEALFRAHGIEPTWHLDTDEGGGAIFGAQNAGALLTFPDTVKWWLFPEGSFLFLDGGRLDLGVVRDSTLNSTNDFQVFFETFEQVAYLGIESLAIVSTVCPSGATGGPATLITC